MIDFSNFSAESKYDDSTSLVVGKIKHEMEDIAIEGLKPKMYSILVCNYGEYKKAKDVSKNGVAKISHNEYKDVLLNEKYFKLLNEQNLK